MILDFPIAFLCTAMLAYGLSSCECIFQVVLQL